MSASGLVFYLRHTLSVHFPFITLSFSRRFWLFKIRFLQEVFSLLRVMFRTILCCVFIFSRHLDYADVNCMYDYLSFFVKYGYWHVYIQLLFWLYSGVYQMQVYLASLSPCLEPRVMSEGSVTLFRIITLILEVFTDKCIRFISFLGNFWFFSDCRKCLSVHIIDA